jgi:hypothetical protein
MSAQRLLLRGVLTNVLVKGHERLRMSDKRRMM